VLGGPAWVYGQASLIYSEGTMGPSVCQHTGLTKCTLTRSQSASGYTPIKREGLMIKL